MSKIHQNFSVIVIIPQITLYIFILILLFKNTFIFYDAPTVVVDDEGVITFASGRMWKASGLWKGVEDGAPSINLDYEGNASRYISSYTSTPQQ